MAFLAALSGALLAVGTLTPASASGLAVASFYALPAHVPAVAGTVLKAERVSTTGTDAAAIFRVMYVSKTVFNRPVAVTGLIFVPRAAPPPGGYPVVSWGHGTDGMARACDPSLHPAAAVPAIDLLLAQGWVVTASDYELLGTPGVLPYLVGGVAARNTIDIVRAARHLRAVHARRNYVVWGHSEGGQTSMFSLHIGSAYAPDLHLDGVVAGAPPSQFSAIYDFLSSSPDRFLLFMGAVGFEAAYGPRLAPLSKVLTKLAIRLAPVVHNGCSYAVERTIDRFTLAQIVKVNPFRVPAWRKVLTESDPASFTTPVAAPLLIYQGGADETIPVISTQILAHQLCATGQDVERWIYPGQSHGGVVAPAALDVIHWIADRFAGDPNPDPYRPVGLPGIMTTGCP